MSTTNPISTNLAALRRARGLTQQSFADAVGVNRVTVARWETTYTPDLDRLPAMAQALGLSIGELAEKIFEKK